MSACDAVDSLLAKNGFSNTPSARRRIIVDKVSQSRGQPGYQVTVDTTSLAAYLKDAAGRSAHLIGIRLETSVKTTAAAVPVTPVTGHAIRGCIYNVKLQGQDGHQYLRDLDARDMIFDGWAREGHIVNSSPLAQDYNPDTANPFSRKSLLYPVPNTDRSIFGLNPTDSPAGTVDYRDISVDFSLIGAKGSMAGLIPLADVLNNQGQFLFTLRDSLAYGGASYSVDAYQVQGETQTAVRVIFDILYIDGVITARRWLLDDYTVTVVDGPFKYPAFRHSYIAARWREEDIRQGGADLTDPYGAIGNANSIANLQVLLGGQSEVQGLTAAQLLSRMRMILESYPHGEINTWNRQAALPGLVPILNGQTSANFLARACEFFVPFAPRASNRPSGAMAYSMDASSLPSGGLIRIIHRMEGELSDAPIKSARDCGCTVHGPAHRMVDEKGNELLTTAPQRNRANRR